MNDGTFKKIGDSTEHMYGPRAVLVCGFAVSEQGLLLQMLEGASLADIAVIFATDTNMTLGVVLAQPHLSGQSTACDLQRAVILSGLTEKELHRIIGAYNTLGLPRPIWATLTPHSETWTLSALLAELGKEHRAMAKK